MNLGSWLQSLDPPGRPGAGGGTWVPSPPEFKSCHGPSAMVQPQGSHTPSAQDQLCACKMGLIKPASWGSKREGHLRAGEDKRPQIHSFLTQEQGPSFRGVLKLAGVIRFSFYYFYEQRGIYARELSLPHPSESPARVPHAATRKINAEILQR